ncbi:MAG: phenylalanine--tRNA ligase subunit beta [Euryarchaeota archaeon]|nr:phenylalanine--tRNA ligase subunit beta [Euryarchaeota archaeon]
MPVIKIDYKELCELLGKRIPMDDLLRIIPMMGSDIENFTENEIYAEFFPNRPDLYSIEGIARALRGFLEIETGLSKYSVVSPKIEINIDHSVDRIRPFIVGAVARGVKITLEFIQELMDFQEDLHWAIGRNRKKVAIGVHDFDKIKPPYFYKAVKPNELKFLPLDYPEPLTLAEILEKHPKGKDFAHLLKSFERYPIILDSNGDVLSMPPVINGELTRVTNHTKNLFIEMTGTDWTALNYALDILTTALAERRATIEAVKLLYSNKKEITPNLNPRKKELRVNYTNQMLGLNLTPTEIAHCLEKMRFGVGKVDDYIEVFVPPYRVDVFHEIDLVEDVAIGYGYEKIIPEIPATVGIGQKHPSEIISRRAQRILIGLGFNEVTNMILSNPNIQFDKMCISKMEGVSIANPVSDEFTIARVSLLPGLLETLKLNKHYDLPQKIFEIGDIFILNQTFETGAREIRKVAGMVTHSKASFTEVKSIVETLLHSLQIKDWKVKAIEHPSFIEGRVAAIYRDSEKIGIFGELHPEILINFELGSPTVGFEINLEKLY